MELDFFGVIATETVTEKQISIDFTLMTLPLKLSETASQTV